MREEIIEHLKSPKWRLNNLYYIKTKGGKKIKFKMNKTQEYLFDNLWYYNIIPKARQLGVTTFFALLYFDQILFQKNLVLPVSKAKTDNLHAEARSFSSPSYGSSSIGFRICEVP